jgi:TonB family protein
MSDPASVATPAEGRARTRWSMTASAVLHALLFAWIVLLEPQARAGETLTEITLLEEGEGGDPAPRTAAPARAPEASAGVLRAQDADQRFVRTLARAEVSPDPQAVAVADDRLNARLAALQSQARVPSAVVAPTAQPALWGAAPATVQGPGGSGRSPLPLTRGGGGGAPLSLARGGGGGAGYSPALARAAAPPERAAASEPARGGDAGARRTLAGVTLVGPIADRPILSHVTPAYPEWAKREAVEGSVTLYFLVGPDGLVRENVLVQKTAGFEEFDENARSALRAWRFQPLRGGRTGDQWGTITFHFRLSEGG